MPRLRVSSGQTLQLRIYHLDRLVGPDAPSTIARSLGQCITTNSAVLITTPATNVILRISVAAPSITARLELVFTIPNQTISRSTCWASILLCVAECPQLQDWIKLYTGPAQYIRAANSCPHSAVYLVASFCPHRELDSKLGVSTSSIASSSTISPFSTRRLGLPPSDLLQLSRLRLVS